MRIKSIISLFSLMSLFAGCTREDMSGCFTQSGLQISFSYEEEGSALPLERADLYLFDAEGRFVCSQTNLTGLFSTSGIYTFSLPEGDYTAVAWGNLCHSVAISPETFVPGVTTIGDAGLSLAGLSAIGKAESSVYTTGPEKNLFYSTDKNIHVASGQMTRIVMPLFRDTKEIDLSVRFVDADQNPCQHGHRLNTTIDGYDGIHNFENSLLVCPVFFYQPATQTDIPGGYDASFQKMRLFIDDSSEIVFTDPDDHGKIFYRKSLMTLLLGTGYDSQQALDRTHVYNLEFRFRCEDGDLTHVTARIFVNGWEYIDMTGEV